MFRERGGSSTFARHAFNELVAFIAGWAILIDYLIVIALAAISVPALPGADLGAASASPGWEIGIAAAVIVAVCVLNILNITGRGRQRSARLPRPRRPRPAAGGDRRRPARRLPSRPADRPARPLHPARASSDIVYAAVVAMLAYAGIEAASDLAPDIDVSRAT